MTTTATNRNVSPRVTLFIVSAVQFLTPFLASAVPVALPVIGREFQAGAVQLSLVQLIYILAVTSLLLPIGRFADIHGRKKIFILGIFSLTIATVLITFAHTIQLFIIFRFIQGVGAAMITSTSVAILSSVFPPEERGKAMGIIIAFVYVGLAAGPTLAGFLITQLGWRWVFWAIVPINTNRSVTQCHPC
jgi:MFS family permease